jgi:hypothetical protein
MLRNKKDIDENLAALGLDFCSYSDKELKANIPKAMRTSAYAMLDRGGNASSNSISALYTQTAVLMIQNELTHRQNARIIELLESLASAQGVAAAKTCSNCNAAVSNTAFCSQCGCKLVA